jgi:hypothetical protein
MSTDTLHQIAQNDTPATVQVPSTINGLIIWAVGRFGGGIVIAVACAWALSKVYEDLRRQTDRMMTLMETRAASDSALATSISGLKTSIEDIAKKADAAHKPGQ